MDYEYDLITGNVNRVWYQKGRPEQFIHRYRYDADNRLTHVLTSQDNITWHHDARYFYLPHGPLARTELGEKQIQGMDYAYTLQGWIKAMNAYRLDPLYDIGSDADYKSYGNSTFAQDAFAYTLQYYGKDYRPVKPNEYPFREDYVDERRDLFNGNIAGMSTQQAGGDPLWKAFRYDKLNRIMFMETAALDANGNWNGVDQRYKTMYRYDFNGNLLYLHRLDEQAYEFHQVQYYYFPRTNRLKNTQAYGIRPSDYQYDANGNLIYDGEERMRISWNAAGKVTWIDRGNVQMDLLYSPMGQRQIKVTSGSQGTVERYYIHDASGNVMCIYETQKDRLFLKEQPIYGSSRLGVMRNEIEIRQELRAEPAAKFTRILGQRRYELPDHLGNVHTSLSDRKQENKVINDIMTYLPQTASFTDYYPFGFPMPQRSKFSQYRYGFNGQEMDEEVYGKGSTYGYEARIYDSRIGRWWSVDPFRQNYSEISPYTFALNTPIWAMDPDGNIVVFPNKKSERTFNRLYNAANDETKAKLDVLKNSDVVYNINTQAYLQGRNGGTQYNFEQQRLDILVDKSVENQNRNTCR